MGKIKLFYKLFLLVVFFVASFFVGNFVFAFLDDNINNLDCDVRDLDCDNNQTNCLNLGYGWTDNGYPNNTGNSMCCEDDSQENYFSNLWGDLTTFVSACCPGVDYTAATCQSGSIGADCNFSDIKCIEGFTECVANDLSGHTAASYYDMDSDGDTEFCATCESIGCFPAIWLDQDDSKSYCQGEYFYDNSLCKDAGPNKVCSDGNSTERFCCGDDADERSVPSCFNIENSACCPAWANFVDASGNCVAECPICENMYYRKVIGASGNNAVSFNEDKNDLACCELNSCVYDGICYSSNSEITGRITLNGSTESCYGWGQGGWNDPDGRDGVFLVPLPSWSNYPACRAFGFEIAVAGEEGVGEYDNTTVQECCGDDQNEFLVIDDYYFCYKSRTSAPPGVPKNLHHTSNTENSITWVWEAGVGGDIDHYIVYNSSGDLLDSTVADATYTWNDLEFPNTQYGIKVVAVNSYGVSDATAISYAYTSIEQPTSLSCTPTKTSLAVIANGTISDPSPTNQYLTKIAFAKDGTYSTWQESASINYSGLTCGTSYNIWAKTRNGDGEERDRVSTTCSTQSCTSGPDLIIDNISFSNSVCRGSTVSASITTKNIGDTATGQTSKTKVFIDSDDTGAGGIANLLDTWANILTANSSQIITTDSWDTTGVSLGEHTLVAIADAPTDSRISESNENNNVLRKSFTVVDCGGGGSSSFYLLTPDNNATGVSVSPTLDWEESIGASSYYIYMCEGVDCTLSLLDSTSNDEYVINTPFNYNTIYKWDVVAWNGTETTDSYNGPFSFTTMAEGVIGTPPTAHYDWCKINDNTIQFLDRSVPGDSPINAWEYDFNDGDKCNPDCTESGYDGTNRNPVHTFTDVDPIYSSPDFGWYSTLENNDSILNQEAGSGATVIGTPTYESAVNGSGMIIDQNNEGVKIPINSTNFDYISGAIQLAYKPDYASNSGEPNHYIFRADGPTGDSFELKYQNNGLYYKIYDADADTQCVISAINIIPGWSADQWLKLVATWNQSTSPKMSLKVYDQNSGNLLNSWTNTTCTMNFSTAITLTDMYVGTWVGGTYNALGTVDDFMMFLNDTYTATLSGGLDVSLKATAENGGTNTYTETLDLTNGPPCGYNLSSVAAINCHTIDLIWQPHSMTVDGYDIYRSTSASGPWTLVKDGATGTTYSNYDADNINENTRYYYYISTSPMSINNSTAVPACVGGVGAGNKCPLSTITPICPIDDFRISTIRKCGSITFRFATIENAKGYEIQKSVGDNLHYTNVLTIAEDQIATYCNDNYCSYTDTEVLPVNIINPASKFKYWYQARAQGQDDTWTNWSTDISDYSYCYRSKDWQER